LPGSHRGRWILAVTRLYTCKTRKEPTVGTSLAGTSVLVTGANRGIGQALVQEALRRGAGRVYAAVRHPIVHDDPRVAPLIMDVVDDEQVQAAAEQVESLDVLVNNAGIAVYDDLSDPAALEEHLAVNLFGAYRVTRAFLPRLIESTGALVNNTSLMALAPFPVTPAYGVSKAALFNLTQSYRALLARDGIRVHAVLTGPTDTDMTRGFEIPKASPGSVAAAIFDGVEAGDEDIFPDEMSAKLAESRRSGAVKEFEHRFAAFVAPAAATS
jgi:NAD(P)-dependent dehydrogenase (short-subunit alcohol dehydrogenase family)